MMRIGLRQVACVGVGMVVVGVGQDAHAQVALPEIVVSAPSPIVGDGTSGDRGFTPVTVVPRTELDRTPGGTLGEVLFSKPGVTGTGYAAGASRPIVRGLDDFRVRVQENGIGSGDVSAIGPDHGVPIDPLATEQIEVVRGPATLRYGPQAIGGVVSGTNNRIPEPSTPEGMSGVARGGVSSVDNGHEAATALDARGGAIAIHGDAYTRQSDDYSIPGGRQANTAARSQGVSIGGSYFFDGGYAGIAVTNTQSLYHIPGLSAAASNTRIDLNQTKITSKGEYRPQSSAIDAFRYWFGASDYKHDELGSDGVTDGVRATFKDKDQEGRFETQFATIPTALGALNTAAGVQVSHQELGTAGEAGGLLAPSETTRAAGYLFSELGLNETLKFQAAGRIGTVDVSGTSAAFPSNFLPNGVDPVETQRSRHFVPASASIGLLQDLPWDIVASVTGQYVERAPEALELFAKGSHDSPRTFEIGDPNLKKEVAMSIEGGLKRTKGDFRFEANVYHTHYNGFIYRQLTGTLCGDEFDTCGIETDLKQVFYAQRDADFTGAELSAQYDLGKLFGGTVGADGQYDFVRAKFTDGTKVPRITPQRLGGGLYWRDDNWFARVGLLHAFTQNDISADETPTAGYNLLKAEVSYTLRNADTLCGKCQLTIGLTGTNLLDEDVRNHVSFNKDEVLLAGRNVRLFATARF
jgi:iron complex outermembrane receptor protein